MPFVSEAQRRKFYATPSLHRYIPEFEAATHGKPPERVDKRKKALHPDRYKNAMKKALGG